MSLPVGKINGLSAAEYHSSGAISSTRLRTAIDSLLLFKQTYIDKTVPAKTSDELDFGTAFHAICESATAYTQRVVINTTFDSWRTNAAKEWRAGQEAAGKIVLDRVEHEMILAMRKGIERNPTAMALLEQSEHEVTLRARIGSYYVQCRPDALNLNGIVIAGTATGPVIADAKTLPSLSDGGFRRALTDRRYDVASEFYREVAALVFGLKDDEPRPRFIFIACEKSPPYRCQCFEVDTDTALVARSTVVLTLRRLKRAYDTGIWDDTPTGISTVSLSGWKVKEAEAELIEARRQLE